MNPQLASAARKGNESLVARAHLRRELKAGGASAAIVVLSRPSVRKEFRSMRAVDFLASVPRITAPTADEFVAAIPARLTASLGDLTLRKRKILSEALAEWGGR